MSNSLLLGVTATVVALVIFLLVSYRELKRVDELAWWHRFVDYLRRRDPSRERAMR